jgi:7-cyano-7-deazaguanine synthase
MNDLDESTAMPDEGPHPGSAGRARSGAGDATPPEGEPVSSPRAVVLLSGGLDSTTALAIAREESYDTYALTVRYGQRHAIELEAARRVASALGVAEYREVAVDLGSFGGSALTDDIPVPNDREPRHKDRESVAEIPVTYVPARNTVLLSLALAWAEVLGAEDIFIGVNALDYSGYPDCRPEFIEAFEAMASLATKTGVEGTSRVRIRAPLIDMSKAEIIRRGIELGVDYGLTTSCYDPTGAGEACGRCDACLLRRRGFEEAGVEDPTAYRTSPAAPSA